MIYLHHRRATKFSSIRKFPPKRENVWTLRIVESWFHSDRSTFLGKVSGKMRYRWVGNSEILVGYDAHLPPSSSATLSSKAVYRVCRYIRGKLLQESTETRILSQNLSLPFIISFYIFHGNDEMEWRRKFFQTKIVKDLCTN